MFTTVAFATNSFPPCYYDIKNTKAQKKKFVQIMLPLIEKANYKIKLERKFIENFFHDVKTVGFENIDQKRLKKIAKLSKKYKIKNILDKKRYLLRVDTVPVSLALTQAAIESGWGKSRFAKEANNIFGHWTYSKKGLVPKKREEGKKHKIRIFNSLQASVDAYILNLNRNRAYNDFRTARAESRTVNDHFNGTDAAKTMVNYSEIKNKYIALLKSVMRANRFIKYDMPQRSESQTLLVFLNR